MNSRKLLSLAFSAAALLGAAATAQAAIYLNFDGAGTTAGDFTPAGVNIGYGQYIPTLDGFGDPIIGSEHWELDLTAGVVPVLDPSTVGWGLAPSPSKALDARGGPVLVTFDTPFNLTHFSVKLDNSSLGDLADTDIKFYDANNALLDSISVNQSTPGFLAFADNVGLVSTILLPSTAFYDNLAAVPEPGTLGFGLIALTAAGCRRIRSRRA